MDLTLTGPGGKELDLGTEIDATPVECANTCFTDAAAIPSRARENRALLGGALRAAGLVNYPSEWWHWSYGDRYWSLLSARGDAVYRPLAPPGTAGT